jgi:hypothetical protein
MKKAINYILVIIYFFSASILAQSDTAYLIKAKNAPSPTERIELYTEAIKLCSPESAELRQALIFRAFDKYSLEDFYGAISDLAKAIEMEVKTSKVYPENYIEYFVKEEDKMAYLLLGDSYAELYKKEKACLSWSKAGERGETDAYERIQRYCN